MANKEKGFFDDISTEELKRILRVKGRRHGIAGTLHAIAIEIIRREMFPKK
jgi:hypothetical protein